MQTHLTCHLQQQNTQDIIHQTKFHLDEWRSHIPKNKCSKFQQQRWAEQGDRNPQKWAARTRVFGMKKSLGGEDKGVVGGRSGGGPGGTHTMPWRGHMPVAPQCGVGAWWVPLVIPRYSHDPLLKIGPMAYFYKF